MTRCSSEVDAFHVSQGVAVLETEASKTVVRARESRVAASPSSLSSQDAVAMPIALVTAQYCLPDVSSVRRGSTVLVNSAGSALGQVAIQIAQLAGTKVCSGLLEIGEIYSHGKIRWPSPLIFDSAPRNFVAGISRGTDGKSVESFFNPESKNATTLSDGLLGDFGDSLHLLSCPCRHTMQEFIRIDMPRLLEDKPDTMEILVKKC